MSITFAKILAIILPIVIGRQFPTSLRDPSFLYKSIVLQIFSFTGILTVNHQIFRIKAPTLFIEASVIHLSGPLAVLALVFLMARDTSTFPIGSRIGGRAGAISSANVMSSNWVFSRRCTYVSSMSNMFGHSNDSSSSAIPLAIFSIVSPGSSLNFSWVIAYCLLFRWFLF